MARGRQPAHAKEAQKLQDALAFISVAGTKKVRPTDTHCMLRENWALMTDGQLYAGYPIEENINCCPQFEQLKAAVKKCGKTLSVTVLDSGRLSMKGDKLRALIPCFSFEDMPDIDPDPMIAPASDELKKAFEVCGVLADENGASVLEASLMLENCVCTSTDRKAMLQYWHGVGLPPVPLIVPKIFTAAVAKQKEELVGIGYSPDHSITFHFKNGAWIKTLLYADKWPVENVYNILNRQANPSAVPEDFIKGVEAISDFSELGDIFLVEDGIQSHKSAEQGAQYEVKGIIAGKHIRAKNILQLKDVIQTWDYQSYDNQVMFFGADGKARGTFTTCFPEIEEESQ